jgi:aryl-alcohol dehydrogenase-like predicted oxidoreductase
LEHRRLGGTGLKVSEFSYGSWVTFGKQVDVAAAADILGTAYDQGVNFFDNAEGYEAGNSEKVSLSPPKKPKRLSVSSSTLRLDLDQPPDDVVGEGLLPTPIRYR